MHKIQFHGSIDNYLDTLNIYINYKTYSKKKTLQKTEEISSETMSNQGCSKPNTKEKQTI